MHIEGHSIKLKLLRLCSLTLDLLNVADASGHFRPSDVNTLSNLCSLDIPISYL